MQDEKIQSQPKANKYNSSSDIVNSDYKEIDS